MMMETAAQLVSFYVMSKMPEKGFLGFGGIEGVKFRGSVLPGRIRPLSRFHTCKRNAFNDPGAED